MSASLVSIAWCLCKLRDRMQLRLVTSWWTACPSTTRHDCHIKCGRSTPSAFSHRRRDKSMTQARRRLMRYATFCCPHSGGSSAPALPCAKIDHGSGTVARFPRSACLVGNMSQGGGRMNSNRNLLIGAAVAAAVVALAAYAMLGGDEVSTRQQAPASPTTAPPASTTPSK